MKLLIVCICKVKPKREAMPSRNETEAEATAPTLMDWVWRGSKGAGAEGTRSGGGAEGGGEKCTSLYNYETNYKQKNIMKERDCFLIKVQRQIRPKHFCTAEQWKYCKNNSFFSNASHKSSISEFHWYFLYVTLKNCKCESRSFADTSCHRRKAWRRNKIQNKVINDNK